MDDLTAVVPVSEYAFRKALKKKIYIRYSKTRPKTRYLAFYRLSPISSITHLAEIDDIKIMNKIWLFKLKSSEQLKIPITKGSSHPIQSIRYATKAKLENAKTLNEL